MRSKHPRSEISASGHLLKERQNIEKAPRGLFSTNLRQTKSVVHPKVNRAWPGQGGTSAPPFRRISPQIPNNPQLKSRAPTPDAPSEVHSKFAQRSYLSKPHDSCDAIPRHRGSESRNAYPPSNATPRWPHVSSRTAPWPLAICRETPFCDISIEHDLAFALPSLMG